MRNFIPLSLSLLTFTACADPPERQTQNLAEAATPVPGRHLPSQFVASGDWYLGRRSIDALVELGGISADAETVARRADGIIDNVQANGFIGARELAALEKPKNWNALFPAEQAAVPELWALLRLEEVPVADSGCAPVATEVVDQFAPPVHELDINALSGAEQDFARRVQLQFDADGDPSSLCARDLVLANENHQAYLPSEAALIQPLMDQLDALLTPPDPSYPRQRVTTDLCGAGFTRGDVDVTPQSTAEVEGTWQLHENNQHTIVVGRPSLRASYEVNLAPVQAGDRLVTYDLATGAENIQGSGENQITLEAPAVSTARDAHQLRVELWRGGQRVDIFELSWGSVLIATTPLAHFLPVELSATNTILYPNWDHASLAQNGWRIENIELQPTPSVPSAWAQLVGNTAPRRGDAGVFAFGWDEPLAYVSVYEGGWGVMRDADGELEATLVPQFDRDLLFRTASGHTAVISTRAQHHLDTWFFSAGSRQTFIVPTWE